MSGFRAERRRHGIGRRSASFRLPGSERGPCRSPAIPEAELANDGYPASRDGLPGMLSIDVLDRIMQRCASSARVVIAVDALQESLDAQQPDST